MLHPHMGEPNKQDKKEIRRKQKKNIFYKRKNYKKAPFSDVHAQLYWALVLGQIACAYALGIAGSAFNHAKLALNINDTWLGLLGAGSLIGLAGSFIMGRISDRFGRKHLLMANMYIYTILSILQFFNSNLLLLFILRVGIGLMIAIDYTVGNSILVEWLPTKDGAKRQSNLLLYWAYGFGLSFLASQFISNWRLMLCSSAVLGLIAAIYRSVVQIPHSPSWLASHGEHRQAQKVIQKNLGKKWGLPKNLLRIRKKSDASTAELFGKKYWKSTLTGTAFYATQAFAFFGISIFLPILLKNMHMNNAFLSGLLYNSAIIVGTAIGIWLFNKMSRRSFLILTFTIPIICLFILALLPKLPSVLTLLVFTVFSIVLSASLLLDFTYTTELFDLRIRATGVGFVIMMSRVGAAAGTFLLPIIVNLAGAYVTLCVCGVILLIGTIICLFTAPETNPKFVKQGNKNN